MIWSRRQFLASAPLAGALAAQPASRRKNVLFIVADDLNTALGCYGNPIVKTPNLDRLAARGVLFDRAYCQFPLCAPSRASFLSGRRPDTTKVFTLTTPTRQYMRDVVMLPELFRKNGWHTAQAGKIYHTGPEHEDPRSWDKALEESGKSPPASEIVAEHQALKPRNHSMSWHKLKTPEEETPDGIVADKAGEWIRQSAREGRSFFMGVGFRRPHSPYAAPKKYFDLYDPSKIPLPAVGETKLLPASAWYERRDQKALSDRETREYIASYYACTSFVDAQVGRILQALDEAKLWDSTVVVFFGDHGYHNGEHGMWHKMTLFEESTRVPLIVYVPGAKGVGKKSGGLVELLDLYPTLAGTCGLKPPDGLEGMSLMPLLEDPLRPGKKAAYSLAGRHDDPEKSNREITYLGRSVRTEQWRYTEWDGGKRGVELYDEQNDPRELRNVAADPRYKGVVAELKRMLATCC
jgi:uncharacterized sulfatase